MAMKRRDFLKTSALALAGASVTPRSDAEQPSGLKLVVLTRGGLIRGKDPNSNGAIVGVLGRGPWLCQHQLHPFYLLRTTAATIIPSGQINEMTLSDTTTKCWDLTGAEVTFVDGIDPSVTTITPPITTNPSTPPTTDSQWDDAAWVPMLSTLATGQTIDPNWPAKLGSYLKLPGGQMHVLKPANQTAASSKWTFENSNLDTKAWDKPISDHIEYHLTLKANTCRLNVDYGYGKFGFLDISPASAGATQIRIAFAAGDVTKLYSTPAGKKIQHFELFYTFLADEKGHDCKKRFVPKYTGPVGTIPPSPGDFCPAPLI